MEPEDSYLTIAAPAEASSRERSSKFLAYAYPVQEEEQIREILDGLRKKYYDATHHATHGGWGREAPHSGPTTTENRRERPGSRFWDSCFRTT